MTQAWFNNTRQKRLRHDAFMRLKAKAEFGMQTGEAGQKTSVERSCFCF